MKNLLFNLGRCPFSLTLAVTHRCQGRCLTCNLWQLPPSSELTPQEYLPLFQSLKKNIFHLTITGGEPFLRTDLPEIIKIAAQKLEFLSYLSFTTNGYLPEIINRQIKDILAVFKHQVSVQISLDGNQEMHDKIRNLTGSYLMALETYRRLLGLSKNSPRLTVSFSYTISTSNVGHFAQFFTNLKKELPEIDIENISLNLEHGGLLYQRPTNLQFSKVFEMKLQKDLDYLSPRSSFRLNFNFFRQGQFFFRRFYLKNLVSFVQNPKKMILPCPAAKSTFFIDHLGDIYPCLIWKEKLGNLREVKAEFWLSSKVLETRRKIKSKNCPICFTPCQTEMAYLRHLPFSFLRSF